MHKEILISYEEICKETFTPEQLRDLNSQAQLRIAMRRLKEARENLGMTQEALSIKSKLPRTTISKIESGSMNISVKKLMQLANAMEMGVEIHLVSTKK